MASPSFKSELLAEFDRLSANDQARVLEFVRSLRTPASRGTPAGRVVKLAAGIDPDDLSRMEAAIEEGCEQVEPHEW